MKAGKGDIKTNLLIQGEELAALQDISYCFTECFGLDARIDNYKGIRPLGLYSWDFECLIAGIESIFMDERTKNALSPDTAKTLTDLLSRIQTLYAAVYLKIPRGRR
jgi:hypothetical protein